MSEAVNHEVLDRLAELLPDLRERAQETEDLRRIPDQSVKQLHEAGFFRLLQPKRYGGYEADPVVFYTAAKQIASACGWIAAAVAIASIDALLMGSPRGSAVSRNVTRVSSPHGCTPIQWKYTGGWNSGLNSHAGLSA